MSCFEARFIDELLKPLAGAPGAQGLNDDVAMMRTSGSMIATMDTLVEGVHFLADDPGDTVGWKALAVNVSDIVAKGALPVEGLLSVAWPQGRDFEEARGLVAGLSEALEAFNVALIGGDTVGTPGPLCLTVTLTGRCLGNGPVQRNGGQPGDVLYVALPEGIGAAGRGLAILQGKAEAGDDAKSLVAAYRKPRPDPELWAGAIAQHAHASLDVSDGLLIDAARLAAASGLGVEINLDAIGVAGTLDGKLADASAGDDYVPLVSAPPGTVPLMDAGFRPVGRLLASSTQRVVFNGESHAWPERTGWQHD
jgi:thiamine-monophosphate kinase